MKKLFTLIAAVLMAVGANAATVSTIWEGSETFDESWSGSFKVESSKFSDIKVGDKIIVTAKPETAVSWQWGAQVFIKTSRGGWAQIAPTIAVSAAGEYSIEVSDAEITIEEEKEDKSKVNVQTSILKELQEYGMIVQGIDATVTKIEKSVYPKYEETGTTIEYNEYGQIMKDQLANFSGDDKVVFNYKVEGDVTGVEGWGIGNLKSLGGNVTLKEIVVEGIGNFSIAFTMDELKNALDDTNTQYNTNGVALSLWAQKGATPSRTNVVVYKAIADEGGEETGGKSWDFTNLAADVIAALEADAKWESSAQGSGESAFTRYTYTEDIAKDTYVDLGEIGFAAGAGIEVGRAGGKLTGGSTIRVDANNRIQLNCSNGVFKIKNLKAGDVVKIQIASANNSEARTFTITNGDKTSVTTTTDGKKTEETITVSADGDLVLQQSKAINVYTITVSSATGIQEIPVKVINNGAIYNLAGQRVNENYKGIVIKNGKKYIQK